MISNEQDSDPASESEDLASTPLSAYDCDSEGGGGWEDVDSDDSDGELRGARKLGIMGLKFQLNAAKAGKHVLQLQTQRRIINQWLIELGSPKRHQ